MKIKVPDHYNPAWMCFRCGKEYLEIGPLICDCGGPVVYTLIAIGAKEIEVGDAGTLTITHTYPPLKKVD